MPPLPSTCHSMPTITAPLSSLSPPIPNQSRSQICFLRPVTGKARGLCCSRMNRGAQTHVGTQQILTERINQQNITISIKANQEVGDRQKCLLHFALSVTAFHSLKNKSEPWPGGLVD